MIKVAISLVVVVLLASLAESRPLAQHQTNPLFNNNSPSLFGNRPNRPPSLFQQGAGSGPLVQGTGTGVADPGPGGVGIAIGIGAAVASPVTNFGIGSGSSSSVAAPGGK